MFTRPFLALLIFHLVLLNGRAGARQAAVPQSKSGVTAAETPGQKRAPTKAGAGTANAPIQSAERRSAIVIKLKASRGQPAAGSDFGISADIENVSDQPVYLNPRGFTMTAPPELDPDGPRDWPAWLPGPVAGTRPPDDSPKWWDRAVVVAAHSKTSAFWGASNFKRFTSKSRLDGLCSLLGGNCSTLSNDTFFPPGTYTINVVGSYWDTQEGAEGKVSQHRTEISAIDLPIVAPQSTLLLGAALGGFFAFLIIPKPAKYPDAPLRKAVIYAGHLLSAMLLSVMVTILLSRLSETQFLIKISINDFWGAITVGFVVGASGLKILKKLELLDSGEETAAEKSPLKPVEIPKTNETRPPRPVEKLPTLPFEQELGRQNSAAEEPVGEAEELVSELKE